jgi:hypothetical protein
MNNINMHSYELLVAVARILMTSGLLLYLCSLTSPVQCRLLMLRNNTPKKSRDFSYDFRNRVKFGARDVKLPPFPSRVKFPIKRA